MPADWRQPFFFWQRGQKWEERPEMRIFSMGMPQMKQGLPGAAVDVQVLLVLAAAVGDGAVVAQGGAAAADGQLEDPRHGGGQAFLLRRAQGGGAAVRGWMPAANSASSA